MVFKSDISRAGGKDGLAQPAVARAAKSLSMIDGDEAAKLLLPLASDTTDAGDGSA